MFYSKSTGGFYSHEIHGDNMPDDAVEITEAYHAELLEGQSQGMRIVADDTGYPVLADPLPPTQDEIEAAERQWRDQELVRSDIKINKRIDNGQPFDDWSAYRVELREWPHSPDFPDQNMRPVSPDSPDPVAE